MRRATLLTTMLGHRVAKEVKSFGHEKKTPCVPPARPFTKRFFYVYLAPILIGRPKFCCSGENSLSSMAGPAKALPVTWIDGRAAISEFADVVREHPLLSRAAAFGFAPATGAIDDDRAPLFEAPVAIDGVCRLGRRLHPAAVRWRNSRASNFDLCHRLNSTSARRRAWRLVIPRLPPDRRQSAAGA